MALNTTIFSGSGPADDLVDQSNHEYLSYAMLCLMLMSIPMVIVPALRAIVFIIKNNKNSKLVAKHNIFLINLLLSDMAVVVVLWCIDGLLTVLYLCGVKVDEVLGVNVDEGCRIIIMAPHMVTVLASKLMFVPLCVDRFIHIAIPFRYKKIVTTKAIMTIIITLWMVAILVTTLIIIDSEPFTYIPSIGGCKPTFH